jgi:hypothetical protein
MKIVFSYANAFITAQKGLYEWSRGSTEKIFLCSILDLNFAQVYLIPFKRSG